MIPKVRAEKRLGSYRLLQMNSAHADRMLTDFPQTVHMGPFHWSGYGYLMIQSRIGGPTFLAATCLSTGPVTPGAELTSSHGCGLQ